MSTYTEELTNELNRVTLRGNADKVTMQKIASIIFRMDQRIMALEAEVVLDDKPAVPPAPVQEKEPKAKDPRTKSKSIRTPD